MRRRKLKNAKKPMRRFARRRNRRAATVSLVRGPGSTIVPDRVFTKVVYQDVYARESAITGLDTYLWSGNGPFDPDVTGTGTQPTGWDELDALYSRYRCHGSKISIQFINQSSVVPLDLILVPTSSNGTSSHAAYAGLPYARNTLLTGDTARGIASLKQVMKTKKIFGLKSLGAETDYTGAFSSNPNFLWYWRMSASTFPGVTIHDYVMKVKITYYVECWNRNQFTAS